MAGNILVFVERREGQVKRPSLEAVSVASEMAATLAAISGGTFLFNFT